MPNRVIVIGAGLSGLRAAHLLEQKGRVVTLLEASDAPGGRVRTDTVDGFRIDRGFQVLLTEYPEVKTALDLKALDLRAFAPGAMVFGNGRFTTLCDPWRRPLDGVKGLFGPPGGIADRFRLATFRSRISLQGEARLAVPEGISFNDALRAHGFSADFIDAFFRPWFGGITLDRSLAEDAAFCRFVFRCLAHGEAAVPALGMGAVAAQLASRLRPGTLRLGARVTSIEGTKVRLLSGDVLEAEGIVVATEGPEAARLLRLADSGSKSVTCLSFAAPRAPLRWPLAGPERREQRHRQQSGGDDQRGARVFVRPEGPHLRHRSRPHSAGRRHAAHRAGDHTAADLVRTRGRRMVAPPRRPHPPRSARLHEDRGFPSPRPLPRR
jgi:phytoene dehydrogenase-like protein